MPLARQLASKAIETGASRNLFTKSINYKYYAVYSVWLLAHLPLNRKYSIDIGATVKIR